MILSGLPEIYFVRHGETDWNSERRYQGRRDIPLNAFGREQASANGSLLSDLMARDGVNPADFDWYVSPLSRALESMNRVQAGFGISLPEPIIDERLIEISFGTFEGHLQSDLMRDGILKQGRRDAEFWQFRPDGGENYDDVLGRVRPFIEGLTRPSVIVAHGGIARIFRHLLEGAPQVEVVNWPTPQDSILHFSGTRMTIYESELGGSGW